MNLGKRLRLNRIFAHSSGRLCSIAVDHFIGYQDGLPSGLRDLPATLRAIVAAGPDAVTMHKGVAISCWEPHAGKVPLILQSTIGRPDDSADENLATPEDAVRLGADAIATAAFVRGPTEAMHLRRVAELVRAAEAWNLPVFLHIYPRSYKSAGQVEISHKPEDIAWTVRCGMELGVDVIKTPYSGDAASFGQIVRSCPVPIVAAGGPKTSRLEEALDLARGVVASGAKGMTIGRNVWGDADVVGNLQAFKAIIHQ